MKEQRIPAVLVLADGATFPGYAFGAERTVFGEAVFTTAMTGYQETMTDPSYHRQIVVTTAPQIGNTGWNDEDNESHDNRIWVAGLVVRDLSRRVSNWRAARSLEEEMRAQDITGIRGVDTRSLVRHLRNYGSIAAGIFTGEEARQDVDTLVAKVQGQPSMEGADLAADVSTDQPYTIEAVGEKRFTVVAYDMGIKTATPGHFAKRGIETVVVPANTPFAEVQKYNPDGVFVSNGPGDPEPCDYAIAATRELVDAGYPTFGICLGHQILALASGAKTFKMKFGHHGANHPVKDLDNGRVSITSQNHGFAVDEKTLPANLRATHISLFDGTLQGLARTDRPAFCFQGHPEASPGPHDIGYLFDRFTALMEQHKAETKNA